jgi:hypothetical protein
MHSVIQVILGHSGLCCVMRHCMTTQDGIVNAPQESYTPLGMKSQSPLCSIRPILTLAASYANVNVFSCISWPNPIQLIPQPELVTRQLLQLLRRHLCLRKSQTLVFTRLSQISSIIDISFALYLTSL